MKPVPRISEAEWEVLAVLWKKFPLTANEIFAALAARHWKLNTVRTFLTRLENKGVLASVPGPEGKEFSPRYDRETCIREAGQSFLKRVFEGATGALLLHFAKGNQLSATDLAELQSILDQKRKGE
jgi:BlaI family transcriptional regulator, penicillinase repressor